MKTWEWGRRPSHPRSPCPCRGTRGVPRRGGRGCGIPQADRGRPSFCVVPIDFQPRKCCRVRWRVVYLQRKRRVVECAMGGCVGPFAWHLALRCGRVTDEFSALGSLTTSLCVAPLRGPRPANGRLKWKRWYRRDTVRVQPRSDCGFVAASTGATAGEVLSQPPPTTKLCSSRHPNKTEAHN